MMNKGRLTAGSLVGLMAVALWAIGTVAFATTMNVPAGKATIQAAIDAAVNGDLVVVAKGTYKENIDFKGKAITVRSTNPTDSTVVAATIIDGDQKGSVVTFQTGETATSVLRGFTLTNGSGTPVGDQRGGGVVCLSSSPTLILNTISGNSALYGGGVYCTSSSPTLINTIVSDNSSIDMGGGIYCEYSSPVLKRVTIRDNTAETDGGGVCCMYASMPSLSNCTIRGNAAGVGGGVACYDSSPTLTNTTITANSARYYAGACHLSGGSATLTNTTISDNSTGVYCEYSASPVLKNTIIAFNTSSGGLYVRADTDCNPVITYCDFYGNTGGNYVNWPDQTGKKGNISRNPLFFNAALDNLHLKSKGGRWSPLTKTWVTDTLHSACIDRGDPTSAFALEPAPNGGRVNIGADGNTPEASKSASAGAVGGSLVTATAASTGSGLVQITVALTSSASVQVSVLNLAGREVAVLPERDLAEGLSTLLWNGQSSSGTNAPAGRYLVRVTARGPGGGQAHALTGLLLGE